MLGLAMKVIPIIAAVSAFCPSPSLSRSFVVANTAGLRQRSNRPSRLSSLYGHVFGRGQNPEIDDVYQLSGRGGSGSDECLRRVSDVFRGGDDSQELEKLSRLSIAELKSLLDQNDIDCRDCLEKRDLVDRLIENKDSRTGYYGEKNDSGLSHEENRVVDTFKRASPSVAFISVGQVQTVQRGYSTSQQDVPTGTGSGFLWDKSGNVVTNFHVIASALKMRDPKIKVKLQGMPPLPATIVGYEPEKDIAVLRVSSRRLPEPIHVGASSNLQVGQSVLAVGCPFGLDYTLTKGIVSALGREVKGVGGRPIKDCIQSDAAINPGNSGGPLLDSRGRLIGVNMAIYSPSGASAGIGFSIPVDTVRRVVNQIIRYGKVVRPSLGLNVANDAFVRSVEVQLRKELKGVMPVEVVKGSPAEKAGITGTLMRSDGSIELGDLITQVNGENVESVEDLLCQLETKKDGEYVTVTLWRKCNQRLTERIRVKLTTSDKLIGGGGARKPVGSAFQ